MENPYVKKYCILCLAFLFSISYAYAQKVQWMQSFSANNAQWGYTLDNKGNVLYLSSTDSTFTLTKYDPCNNILWIMRSDTFMHAGSVTIDREDNVYFLQSGNASTVLTKLSPLGNYIWERKVENSNGFVKDKDGYIFLSGTDANGSYAMKISEANDSIWEKPVSSSDLMVAPDNSFYTVHAYNGQYAVDHVISHYDVNGNLIDSNDFTVFNAYFYQLIDFAFDTSSHLYLCEQESDQGEYYEDIFCYNSSNHSLQIIYDGGGGYLTHFKINDHDQKIISFSSSLYILADSTTYPTSGTIIDYDTIQPSVIHDSAAAFIFGGYYNATQNTTSQYVVLNQYLELLWKGHLAELDAVHPDITYFGASDKFGDCILSALKYSYRPYSSEDSIFVVNVILDTCWRVSDPSGFSSCRAFPDPFTDQVKFYCPKDDGGSVHLTIYDLLGRVVESSDHMTNENEDATITWTAPSVLGRQLYLYRIQTAKHVYAGKIVKE